MPKQNRGNFFMRQENVLRVALYPRVSTEEQVLRGYSLEAQEEALVRYASEHNMKVVMGLSERIVCITVNAHAKGKIIDSHINAFSPERAGALPMVAFTKKCFSGDWDYDTAFKRQMGGGGLVAYLGTSDVQEVERRIDAGDKDADFYFDAMIYQIAKDIGGMATVMNGQVDRVILTGEIARSQRLVERLRRRVEFIAPVEVVPGAVEMDALVAGALRMLRGQEEIRDYDTERND